MPATFSSAPRVRHSLLYKMPVAAWSIMSARCCKSIGRRSPNRSLTQLRCNFDPLQTECTAGAGRTAAGCFSTDFTRMSERHLMTSPIFGQSACVGSSSLSQLAFINRHICSGVIFSVRPDHNSDLSLGRRLLYACVISTAQPNPLRQIPHWPRSHRESIPLDEPVTKSTEPMAMHSAQTPPAWVPPAPVDVPQFRIPAASALTRNFDVLVDR